MEKCSVIAYRRNYLIEEHNKKLGMSNREMEKLIKKGSLSDADDIVIETLGILLYATMSQAEYYIKTRYQDRLEYSDNNTDVRKIVRKLCDFGLVHSFSFHSKDDMTGYSTCNIYALTKSGIYYMNKHCSNESQAKSHTPITLIASEEDFIEVLNRVAFNGFLVNAGRYKMKTYLSYMVGTIKAEGRFVVKSEQYSFGQANIFVLPVRNCEDSSHACVSKINAIQDHCESKKQKRPWFIFICEDDMHERQLYRRLQECGITDTAVVFMTKDTYLFDTGVDSFDNLTVYKEDDKGLVSDFMKIVF